MALSTYTWVFGDILENREYFERDSDRAIHEMADSLCPVYNGEVIAEWTELGNNDSDRWQEMGMAEDASIIARMSVDLFLYYLDLVERAWAEVQETHTCEAEKPASVTISPSGAIASCDLCSFKSALWECACELEHECKVN